MSRSSKPIRIGVDIGGTFTDLQILDARSGAIVSHKRDSRAARQQADAFVDGLRSLR